MGRGAAPSRGSAECPGPVSFLAPERTDSDVFLKRFPRMALGLGLVLFTGACASSAAPQPPPRAPEPAPPVETRQLSAVPSGSDLPTLAEILGPVDFDPDTVSAGRFDTGRMWTFDAPPIDYFQEAYGFRPDADWMRQARMASLRMGTFCSASFVSASGLVLTNHHCGRDAVTQVSREGENLLEEGFYAATLGEERRVEGLYMDQLVEIADVTARVHGAMDEAADEERLSVRDTEIEAITAEYDARNGMINQVVELFNGGRYSVYTYKRYEDVRLVFAPELAMGYFGGDPDNFTYPRYNLDISIFRVYQDDLPLDSSDFFFKWSDGGPRLGEAVFVLGNPGSTTRLNTVAQLAFTRDYDNPAILTLYRTRMKALRTFLDTHPDLPDWEEQNNFYFNISNSEKATSGQQRGLEDAWMMARKADWERSFREAVRNNPRLFEQYGDPWSEIARAREAVKPFGTQDYGLIFGGVFSTQHLAKAFLLEQYRFARQQGMPADSEQLAGLARQIRRPITNHPDYERLLLAAQLEGMVQILGKDDPVVVGLLGTWLVDGSLADPDFYLRAAEHRIQESILGDEAAVEALLEGAPKAISDCIDPMVKALDGVIVRIGMMQQTAARQAELEEAAQSRLARAVYDVYGTSIPPDATFTLRIADGVVTGYPYNGTLAPAWTTYYGLYDRWASNGGKDPWALPDRWLDPPEAFDPGTPLNFVATCDIIGGNSGSPVVNRELELVGVAFDGNIESLPGEFIFLPELNRCVSVHSEGILEAIRDLFGAAALAQELEMGRRPAGR
jgi:S1-C subfamily serine protease